MIVCRVRKIGEFKDDIIPQQLDQAGESNDLQQKDTFDGPISNDSKYRDKFQGFKKGYSNPHSVECHSESEYGQKPENLIFYDESCSSPKVSCSNFEEESKASDCKVISTLSSSFCEMNHVSLHSVTYCKLTIC